MPSLDWVVKGIFVQSSHLGVDGCPQVGNVNVCPRSVGVSAMSSCPEHLSHWAGASGIPQLPYKNVDVYSDFLNLNNDGQMPVAHYSLDERLAALRTTYSAVCHPSSEI